MFKLPIQSAWQLTVAIGNLIVVVIAESDFEPADELLFFSFLLCVASFVFSVLSYRYNKVRPSIIIMERNDNGEGEEEEIEQLVT